MLAEEGDALGLQVPQASLDLLQTLPRHTLRHQQQILVVSHLFSPAVVLDHEGAFIRHSLDGGDQGELLI